MSSHSHTPADRRSSVAARVRAAVRALLQGARQRGLAGHLDEIHDGVLHGWAWNAGAPRERPVVDLFVDGRFAGRTLAHLPRTDLGQTGVGDGRYGFEFLAGMPGDGLGRFRAFALDADGRRELARSAAPAPQPEALDARAYLRATFASSLTRAAESPPHRAVPATPCRAARLLAPTGPGGASAYVAHVAAREGAPPPTGRADALRAYLLGYARRRAPMRAPLSADDIAFLCEGPGDGAPLAPGRGQAMLSRSAAREPLEAAYVWAAFESAALGVEDCLVPERHRDALAAADADGDFPLSRFMRRFLAGTPLQTLRADDEADRRIAWLALTLAARAMPHVLPCLPAERLDAFMRGGAFDEAMRDVFGKVACSADDWRADIARAGYDLEREAFAWRTDSGDRLWSAALPARKNPLVDIQIIGPFARRLGVAESCRTLAAALRRSGRTLRLCDHALDHPNATRDAAGFALEAPGPARLTVLHLNLEDIPAALAYLPDVFSDTHLIAFPYLELPKPDAVHALGLGLVDGVWAASRFIADALAPARPAQIVGTACRPLRAVGKAAARARAYANIAVGGAFVFLTAGDALSGAHRKNPLGAVAAFQSAFPDADDVRLVVKTHSSARAGLAAERAAWEAVEAAASADARIIVIDRLLDDDDMAALIEGADCLVSLHRAEGFGYHLAEAMQLGTVVVATAWSGNLDFCTPQTAFLVGYDPRPIAPGEYFRAGAGQTWAEPRLASAVAALRAARDPAARAARIEAAREAIARDVSLDAFAARLAPLVAAVLDRAT